MSDQPARPSRTPATSTGRPQTRQPGSDELPYVDDPVSRLWVMAIVAVFALIFLYALLAGRGGLFTPVPTASPSPSPSPVTSPSPSPSPSPALTPTSSPAASPTPAGSPSPTTVPSPTASPSG